MPSLQADLEANGKNRHYFGIAVSLAMAVSLTAVALVSFDVLFLEKDPITIISASAAGPKIVRGEFGIAEIVSSKHFDCPGDGQSVIRDANGVITFISTNRAGYNKIGDDNIDVFKVPTNKAMALGKLTFQRVITYHCNPFIPRIVRTPEIEYELVE